MTDVATSLEKENPTSDQANPTRSRVLAHVLFGASLAALGAGIVFSVLDPGTPNSPGTSWSDLIGSISFGVAFFSFVLVGYLLAARRPDNAVSWVVFATGIAFSLDALITSYANYALHGGAGGSRLGALAAAVDSPMWIPIVALPATFALLLFPDGHLPSPRWRWVARGLAGALTIMFLAILVSPGSMADSGYPHLRNPLGVVALRHIIAVAQISLIALPLGVAAAVVSLIRRFRRSTGVERLQLRWLVSAATIVGVLYAVALILSIPFQWTTEDTPPPLFVLQTLAILAFVLIPVAIGVSVLRYRLLDIDVVINRALLYGALAIFITLVYAAVVVGIGAFVGSKASPFLSAAAAAIVAIAFQPARRRLQHLADRMVYGKRATPYEVLSEFADRLGTAYAADELLPKMAAALAEGTAAARADIWIRVGDELRVEATWPEEAERLEPVAVAQRSERTVTSSDIFEPVSHQGEFLGALTVTKRPGAAVTSTEERLVRDLAGQAGLVLRNVALTEQLMANIEQLRASRQRLVAAQDDERRKLERNLHDGAQQQLVALTVQLRLLQQLVPKDPERAAAMAADLQALASTAVEDLRDLARGIYPPLLADKGLVAALESQARRSTIPVAVQGDGLGRYSREAESAIYFSCLEALQNVSKYAGASQAVVRLFDGDGRVHFEVSDDGVGFDAAATSYGTGLQGMADRLAAAGGEVLVRSTPGAGTTVSGSVPAAAPA
jgi:signal transduction histidine kinase